mmetsp:Transcript_35936/g.79002  ORF Transcript_35936/g.79002 Transcript_35936/m.79002 type:complete len:223 (+) Transcript_35936:97-765(+)
MRTISRESRLCPGTSCHPQTATSSSEIDGNIAPHLALLMTTTIMLKGLRWHAMVRSQHARSQAFAAQYIAPQKTLVRFLRGWRLQVFLQQRGRRQSNAPEPTRPESDKNTRRGHEPRAARSSLENRARAPRLARGCARHAPRSLSLFKRACLRVRTGDGATVSARSGPTEGRRRGGCRLFCRSLAHVPRRLPQAHPTRSQAYVRRQYPQRAQHRFQREGTGT